MKILDWKRIWGLAAAAFLFFQAVFFNVVFAQSKVESDKADVSSDSTIESSEPGIILEGICGENVFWTLDENGKLLISGNGEMWDYHLDYDVASDVHAPWWPSRNQIKSIVVEKSVTSVGESI